MLATNYQLFILQNKNVIPSLVKGYHCIMLLRKVVSMKLPLFLLTLLLLFLFGVAAANLWYGLSISVRTEKTLPGSIKHF